MWDPTGSQRTTRGKRLQFNSYLVPNPKLRAARVHVHNTYVRGLWVLSGLFFRVLQLYRLGLDKGSLMMKHRSEKIRFFFLCDLVVVVVTTCVVIP